MSQATSPVLITRNGVSTPAQTSVGAGAGQILAVNTGRRGMIIQNTGTTVIYLTLGSATPTASVYHIALKAAAAQDDGSGGVYLDDVWTGAVQAIGSGGGGTLVITEIS